MLVYQNVLHVKISLFSSMGDTWFCGFKKKLLIDLLTKKRVLIQYKIQIILIENEPEIVSKKIESNNSGLIGKLQ